MTSYDIRPVREEDLKRIIAFFANEREQCYAFPEAPWPLTADVLKQSIDSRSDSSVVLRGSAPVAFANLFKIVPGEECTIGNVVVDAKHRRKGAAQFLLRSMIDIAAEKYRVGRVIAPCWSENTAGLMLYSRLGFHTYDTVIRHFPIGDVPVQLMEKCIDFCVGEPSPVGTI